MTDKLRVLDLFSGIGGFSLGLERTGGFETVAFCEIDKFCQRVLKKHWPDVPIFEDVRTINADEFGRIDVVTGGYPCQPFSTAGKRQGDKDDRHLWPAMFSIIKAGRPTWIIGENVAGHVSMGLDQVLSDLEGEGYTTRPYIIPACAVDAAHRRDRVWIMAHSLRRRQRNSQTIHKPALDKKRNTSPYWQGRVPISGEIRRNGSLANTQIMQRDGKQHNTSTRNGQKPKFGNCGCSIDVADTSSTRREKQHFATVTDGTGYSAGGIVENWRTSWWPVEPGVGRVANGIPRRVDRLRGLGNAVVPQIPEIIGHAILEAEKHGRAVS